MIVATQAYVYGCKNCCSEFFLKSIFSKAMLRAAVLLRSESQQKYIFRKSTKFLRKPRSELNCKMVRNFVAKGFALFFSFFF